MLYFRVIALCFLYGLSFSGLSAQPSAATDVPLAKVGGKVITRREFVARYELAPTLQRTIAAHAESNKMLFLASLIAEKLLDQAGTDNHLDEDSLYRVAVASVERSFVRDELYRREVSDKVRFSKAEIAEALRLSQADYKVYFLFAATSEGAQFLLQQMRQGKKLEDFKISPDTTSQYEGPDSAIARWGDIDERMEKVIYSMKLGETSEPIQLDDGYYIVKVMGKSVTVFESDKEKKDALERVQGILRKRKEDKRMFEYMSATLKTKKAEANAKMFREATSAIGALQEKSDAMDKRFILSGAMMDSLHNRVQYYWDSVFVMFSHTHWTLGEALEKMSSSRFFVDNPTPLRIRKAFDQRLRDLIDQEHLTQQGYQNKLNLTDAVRNDLVVWRDYFLADRFRQKFRDTVSVTSNDVKDLISFYRANDPKSILVKTRHIVVDSLAIAEVLIKKLQQGESFTDLMYQYSNDGSSLPMIGKEEYVFLSSLEGRENIIDSLHVGEYSPPVSSVSGYEIIYLVDRKYVTFQGKDSLALTDQELREEVRKEKLHKFLTDALGPYANKYKVQIYWKNFQQTEVTHIPAMVYRFLGFGGRMFAVPFLDIQVDWLNNWDRKDILLP